jgi:hypothetical protein
VCDIARTHAVCRRPGRGRCLDCRSRVLIGRDSGVLCTQGAHRCVHTGIMSKFVTMRWPEGLTEQVDAVAGPGGRTEFVVAAVYAALDGTPGPAVVEPPKREPAPDLSSAAEVAVPPVRACGSFKPRPGNALRCFTCGQRKGDHA